MSTRRAVLVAPGRVPTTKARTLLVADLFCGAGGTSTGARLALKRRGLKMILVAINHWQTAIETHTANHPGARHLRVDVYKTKPREAVPGGRLDLLMASPTCIYYSRARGGRPVSWDQRKGRMTPTQVLRWVTELDVRCLLVENVPEFQDWGPVCKRTTSCKRHAWSGPRQAGDICGKPIREKRGIYFRAWVKRIERLGYRLEWRILNAADFGDATTRMRFFLIARKDGAPIEWPTPTHSKAGTPDLFGGGAKPWRAAREVIDWAIEGRSIFDRKRTLAAKTLLRIYAGLIRFGWPWPFVEKLRRYMTSLGIEVPEDVAASTAARARALLVRTAMHKSNALCVRESTSPLPTITTDGGVGLLEPFVLSRHGDNNGATASNRAHSVDDPLPTATARGAGYVVEPKAEPFTFQMNQAKDRARGFLPVGEPLGTIVTKECRGLVEPDAGILVLRKHADMRSADAPLPAVTAGGTHLGVVEPFILPQHFGNPARSVDLPAPPPVTVDRTGLVEPFMLSQASGGAPREVAEPVPAIPTDGAHALIAPYYGASECTTTERQLPTVTTRDRFGLVTPVTPQDSSNRARSVDEPLPTVTGAARGELAFISAGFGERKGQAARVHSVDEPAPTLCAQGGIRLVQGRGDLSATELDELLAAVDIKFRMLVWRELARAMGFPRGYRFAGNKTQVTRQIGNAVPVNTADALVGAIFAGEAA